jgi:hypothetical protein
VLELAPVVKVVPFESAQVLVRVVEQVQDVVR